MLPFLDFVNSTSWRTRNTQALHMNSSFFIRTPTGLDRRLFRKSASPRELSQNLSWNRREFLRGAAGVALGSTFVSTASIARAAAVPKSKKVVVITFVGGARDQET